MKITKKQNSLGSPLFLNAEIKHPGLEYFSDDEDKKNIAEGILKQALENYEEYDE